MAGKLKAGFDEALSELERGGLLLVHDNTFPSLTKLTIGEPIRGSWWAHPLSNDVYMVGQKLQHSGEVTLVKLVSGKETYVHRRLWPQVVAIGISREAWQMESLGTGALAVLAEVDRQGTIRMDQFSSRRLRKELNEDARTLAARLLVFADDVHTASGAHARRLATWQSWAARHGIAVDGLPSSAEARSEFDNIVRAANTETGASAFLPWREKRRR